MCQEIFLGSKTRLPLIDWNEDAPGFYVREENAVSDLISRVLDSEFYYKFGSHMGCACGLCYDDGFKDSKEDDYEARVRDVKSMLSYLDTHKHYHLKLFSSSWDVFPGEYPSGEFHTDADYAEEFWMEENVVMVVK